MEFPGPKKSRDLNSLILKLGEGEEEAMGISSSMSIRKLPEELHLEIVARLPVKSVLKCKSVCKSWCSMISNPSFAKFHIQQNKNNSSCNSLLIGYGNELGHKIHCIGYDDLIESSFYSKKIEHSGDRDIWYPFKVAVQHVRLYGSCNGLVFLWLYDDHYDYRRFDRHERFNFGGNNLSKYRDSDSDTDNDSDRDTDRQEEDFLCVWNPTTREYKRIPNSPNEYDHKDVCIYGLGYDARNDDYKFVVGICSDKTEQSTLVEIFSLRANSWETIETPYRFTYQRQKSGVLVNGDLHWLAKGERGLCIVYLGSSSEMTFFKEIQLPAIPDLKFISVGVLEERRLCVVADNGYPDGFCRVEVWEMQVYGVPESWNKRHVISNVTITEAVMDKHSGLKIMWSFQNGNIVFLDRLNVVLYDPKLESAVERNLDCLAYFTTEINYLQSLVSLNTGTYVGKERLKRKTAEVIDAEGTKESGEDIRQRRRRGR